MIYVKPHFPTTEELGSILKKEKRFSPPKINQSKPINYSYLKDLLKAYKIETRIFDREVTSNLVIEESNKIINVLKNEILINPCSKTVLNGVFDYLSENDSLQKSDFIFVHGSPSVFPRAEVGVKLYKEKWAPKVVFSGGYPSTDRVKLEKPEAETYFDYALSQGMPKGDIYLEKESITIPDNIRKSLILFKNMDFKPKSMILVTSNSTIRRAYAGWLKYTTDLKVIRHGVAIESRTRDNWYKAEDDILAFLTEYFKLRNTELLGDL